MPLGSCKAACSCLLSMPSRVVPTFLLPACCRPLLPGERPRERGGVPAAGGGGRQVHRAALRRLRQGAAKPHLQLPLQQALLVAPTCSRQTLFNVRRPLACTQVDLEACARHGIRVMRVPACASLRASWVSARGCLHALPLPTTSDCAAALETAPTWFRLLPFPLQTRPALWQVS